MYKRQPYYLNAWGDYIYYSDLADGGKLYRIKKDGTGEKEKLNDIRSNYVNIVDGKIYFCSEDMTGEEQIVDQGIYEMDLDGSNLKRITTDDAIGL